MRICRSCNKLVRISAFALFIFFFFLPNTGAQGLDPRVTLFGGGSSLKGERTFLITGDAFRSSFANGGKVGFRGTVDLSDHWAVEGAYSFGSNNLRIFELANTPPKERAFGVRVHQLIGNLIYYLNPPSDRLRPFATAGLGLSRFSPTSDAKAVAAAQRFIEERTILNGSNEFNFNFGVGLEAKVYGRFGVRFDFRDHLTRLPRFGVPQAPRVSGQDFFPVSGVTHDLETSLGIVLHLKP